MKTSTNTVVKPGASYKNTLPSGYKTGGKYVGIQSPQKDLRIAPGIQTRSGTRGFK